MSLSHSGPVMTTARMTMTPACAQDFEDLVALWSDPDFTRFIVPGGRNAEEVWLRLLRDIGHWSAFGFGNWTLRLTGTGDYVGSVGVFDFRRAIDPAFDAPELGWGVAPRHQGQGLAHEALEVALAWIDHTRLMPRTVCMIDPGNGPSLRLAARSGYAEYVRTTYKSETVILLERERP